MTRFGASSALILVFAARSMACGVTPPPVDAGTDGGPTRDAAGVNPLVGTWRRTYASGGASITSEYAFDADMTMTWTTTTTYPAGGDAGLGRASCVETSRNSPAMWSATPSGGGGTGETNMTLSLGGMLSTTTMTTGCADPARNLPATTTPPASGSLTVYYQINGNSLIWQGSFMAMTETYTRVTM